MKFQQYSISLEKFWHYYKLQFGTQDLELEPRRNIEWSVFFETNKTKKLHVRKMKTTNYTWRQQPNLQNSLGWS